MRRSRTSRPSSTQPASRAFACSASHEGGSVAIEYACRRPDKVTHLVRFGASGRGWMVADPKLAQKARALFLPGAAREQQQWFTDLMRVTSKPDIAANILRAYGMPDMHSRLADIRTPTLVLHCRNDA